MVAALVPERDMRGPGCDDRCQVVRAMVIGVFGRSELLLHSAEAHETYGRVSVGVVPSLAHDVVATGPLVVDLGSLQVWVHDRQIPLSATELRLLTLLARRLGQAVPYVEIARYVWAPTWGLLEAVESSNHTRHVLVNRLRKRLGEAGPLLVTLPNMGLRLERVPAGQPAPTPCRVYPILDRWSTNWDRCRGCGRTDRPHNGRGYCTGCHHTPRDQRFADRASS